MSAHTPGPWHVRGPARTSGWGVCIVGGLTYVARIPGRASARKEANTRLIAAAPELLDALRELTIAAEAAGWDVDAANAPILNAARTALANATADNKEAA